MTILDTASSYGLLFDVPRPRPGTPRTEYGNGLGGWVPGGARLAFPEETSCATKSGSVQNAEPAAMSGSFSDWFWALSRTVAIIKIGTPDIS